MSDTEACWLNEDCIGGYHHEGECRFPSWQDEADLAGLRAVAEAATPERLGENLRAHRERWRRFEDTFDPPTVLGLLDRLEAAEAKVTRVEALADEMQRVALPSDPGMAPWDYAEKFRDALEGGGTW